MNPLGLLLVLQIIANPCAANLQNLYLASYHSPQAAQSLEQVCNDKEIPEPFASAYKGISQMMLCRYTSNPFKKLSYFLNGKTLLDAAINQAPAISELRFLRFTVQTNAPGFLLYKDNIEEYKKDILSHLLAGNNHNTVCLPFDKTIYSYMATSPFCSANERKELTQHMSHLTKQ